LISECWHDGGTLLLSAVTAWEISLLVDSRKIELDLPVADWLARFVERPGVAAVPLVLRAGARAYRFAELEHRDPADRLLMASAIELDCPLVTYDDRIVRFAATHGEKYGLTTVF
jgi:PIN domain nuclease of toxin-antitoxin system